MAGIKPKVGKSIPSVGKAPSWALGTRPESLRTQRMQRVKPMAGSMREYGKDLGPQQPNLPGIGAGNTATQGYPNGF